MSTCEIMEHMLWSGIFGFMCCRKEDVVGLVDEEHRHTQRTIKIGSLFTVGIVQATEDRMENTCL